MRFLRKVEQRPSKQILETQSLVLKNDVSWEPDVV